MTIEQKAKAYDEAIKVARSKIKNDKDHVLYEEDITDIFPVLAESEDEEIRKAAIAFVKASDHFGYHLGISKEKVIAWLENEQKPVINVPPREVVLSIWDLGNEWKELTNGSISTEYGTQLDYIQKHWHESEYYLKEKKCEQKPTWSEEDEAGLGDALWAIQQARAIAKDENDMGNLWYAENWLKSLKDRVQPKQEWSEDDEQYLLVCKNALRKYQVTDKWDSNIISQWLDNKLKSIKDRVQPQPRQKWKPTEEQMCNLSEAAHYNCAFFDMEILKGLYDDLKRIKDV